MVSKIGLFKKDYFYAVESTDSYIDQLIECIQLEELEQIQRYRLDEHHSLKVLKNEGLAIHPISVSNKSFGYADYPEVSFKILFPSDNNKFKEGAAIECFIAGEEPIKGILLLLEGKRGEMRLFAPDFPDWIEDDGIGIKLAPDSRTTQRMVQAMSELRNHTQAFKLYKAIHEGESNQITHTTDRKVLSIDHLLNKELNASQQLAIENILGDQEILIVHGPPGTGKTTTLVEAVFQLLKQGERVLISAPSNTAVDNFARALKKCGIDFLRVGNNSKIEEDIFPYTTEGRLQDSKISKDIKKLKIRAEEFRRMSNQYKRKFGKEEREQRNLLIKEVKSIRKEIKSLQIHNEELLFEKSRVILGTPIGLTDNMVSKFEFDTLIIDEAGQCLEPLAWCIIPLAKKVVLAGDHNQLPPTVLSEKASKLGLSSSILEQAYLKVNSVYLLDTQYRMHQSIAEFSNRYFYEGKIQTPQHLISGGDHLFFYDTAGAGFDEEHGKDGVSLMNQGEIDIILKLIAHQSLDPTKIAIISPYAGQVALAKEFFPKKIRVSTIDSFQGQEKSIIILSLVRSNSEGQIGFLKDYRRMNVAMTRAKDKLYIIGDSSTIGKDPYFAAFLDFIESTNSYRSIWEILY